MPDETSGDGEEDNDYAENHDVDENRSIAGDRFRGESKRPERYGDESMLPFVIARDIDHHTRS